MTEKLYAEYRTWNTKNCTAEEGIIVGSDLTQEWLLPWWLAHYRRHNAFPIAFVDFGMSDAMKKWCQDHGELIRLYVADIFVTEKTEVHPSVILELERTYGKEFWPCRNAWFKKPLACLQSPFHKSLWVDLDCEIRGSLKPLFDLCDENPAMAEDPNSIPEDLIYNSGVFAFKKGLKLIEEWADASFERNHEFRGDQEILNTILRGQNIPITEIPLLYNWSRCYKENPQAIILHWHGLLGKVAISHQIAKSSMTPMFGSNTKYQN
jgi:hypothetical protein